MTTKKPQGRLYQESEFVFDELNGLQIERLIICKNVEIQSPILIYLKVENKNWHQYFLDAGIGFWENWDELDDIENDEHFDYIDSTEELKLNKKRILKIYCVRNGELIKITK